MASSGPVTLGGPGMDAGPSSMPGPRGVDTPAVSILAARGVQTSHTRTDIQTTHTHDDNDDTMTVEPLSLPPDDDPFVCLNLNQKNSLVRSLILDRRVTLETLRRMTARHMPLIITRQIYHLIVDKLKVLDRGNGAPWDPPVPSMPEPRTYSPGASPRKRARDDGTDAAFNNFGKAAATSGPKKPRRR